jgi:hypothetical protein
MANRQTEDYQDQFRVCVVGHTEVSIRPLLVTSGLPVIRLERFGE